MRVASSVMPGKGFVLLKTKERFVHIRSPVPIGQVASKAELFSASNKGVLRVIRLVYLVFSGPGWSLRCSLWYIDTSS